MTLTEKLDDPPNLTQRHGLTILPETEVASQTGLGPSCVKGCDNKGFCNCTEAA